MNQNRRNNQYTTSKRVQQQVTIRKPKIHYIDGVYVVSNRFDEYNDYFKSCINIMKENIFAIYNDHMPEFIMDKLSLSIYQVYHKECNGDKQIFGKKMDHAMNNISSLCKNIIEKFSGRTFKVICNSDVLYVTFSISNDNGKYKLEITLTHFKGEEKIAINNVYIINLDENLDSDNKPVTMIAPTIYLALKEKYLENYLTGKDFSEFPLALTKNEGIGTFGYMIILESILSNFSHIIDINDNLEEVKFNHTELERKLLNKVVYQNMNYSGYIPKLTIFAYANVTFKNDNFLEGFKSIAERFDTYYNLIMNPSGECPLIDFNEREQNFIRQYMDQTNIFTDDLDNIKPYINFIDVLEHPRYGREMMMNTEIDGETYKIHFTYDFDKYLEQLIILVSMERKDGVKILFKAGFVQIKTFNYTDSFYNLSVDILYPADIGLPKSFDSLMEDLSPSLRSKEIYVGILEDIISFYCIIYVRPERSKVIKATTRISGNSGSSNFSKDSKNEDFVIRRILKDTKSAKEYIKEMTSHEYRDVEYTIEKWDRAGHWRRLPHSDEKIWIEPTTCHRRLEMSEKEIHIKL